MEKESVNIKLDVFEGPFDLLYHLIEKHEIDIYHIPISELTDQYLEYIGSISPEQMDGLSRFIVMAATLLEIKSKMLLPRPPKEDESQDPREELVQKLVEYKAFKEIAEVLKENHAIYQYILFNEPKPEIKIKSKPQTDDLLEGITLDKLQAVFIDLLNRRELKVDKLRSGFNSVAIDSYKISNKIEYISKLLTLNNKISFSEIFSYDSPKLEKVVTFLALLELIKAKQVTIYQDGIFDEIIIRKANQEDEMYE